MKFEVDIDLDALAAAVAPKVAALLAKAPAAAPAAPKPATKPAAAAKPAAAPKAAAKPAEGSSPERESVHEALRAYAKKHGKEDALVILRKYSPSIAELPEDKFASVLAELNGEAAPPPVVAVDEDDPF